MSHEPARNDSDAAPETFTAFDGHRRLASGALADVALSVKRAIEGDAAGPVLIYHDRTGRTVEVDTRGSEAALMQRLAPAAPEAVPRGPGRPRLGVVAREVTLLPRHWEWLAEQPGGASVALRKLVEYARRHPGQSDRLRRRHEAAYHFISSMAGDFPGFEEAARALFADDEKRFRARIAAWPRDVRAHALAFAFPKDPATP